MKSKGQISIEFLVAFSIILILFTLFSFVVYQKLIQSGELKIDIAGQRLSNSIAQGINKVYVGGEGSSQVLTLPQRIALQEYQVKFFAEEPTIFLFTTKQSWSSPLFTPYVNCTLPQCSSSGGVTTLEVNETFKVELVNKEEKIYLNKYE